MANLFTQSATMSKKAIVNAKSTTKREARETLAQFGTALAAEFGRLTKSTSKEVRDCVNAMRSKYPANKDIKDNNVRAVKQAVDIVAACYPYQTAEGVLLRKVTERDEGGNVTRRYWDEKKLTASSARGIVLDCVKNFTNTIGAPSVEVHAIDEDVK